MEREAKRMKEVRKCFRLVPRCYGTLVFKDSENRYRMGILMQHIGETSLWKLPINHSEIYENVQKSLNKRNFAHGDLHSKNIMHFKGKFWPIDYDDVYRINR